MSSVCLTVPVVVAKLVCGVTVIVLPEAQYEYCASPAVITLSAVVYVPPVDGADGDTTPNPPVC